MRSRPSSWIAIITKSESPGRRSIPARRLNGGTRNSGCTLFTRNIVPLFSCVLYNESSVTKKSSRPERPQTALNAPVRDTCQRDVPPAIGRTKTSRRPNATAVYASHRPSGDTRGRSGCSRWSTSVMPESTVSAEHCAIHLAGIVQPQDMGVLQVGRGRDFVEEPVCSDHRCEFGPQHLERDFAPVLHIFREVYGGHSSGAKLALDPVPLEECRVQAIQRGGHAVKDAALNGSSRPCLSRASVAVVILRRWPGARQSRSPRGTLSS